MVWHRFPIFTFRVFLVLEALLCGKITIVRSNLGIPAYFVALLLWDCRDASLSFGSVLYLKFSPFLCRVINLIPVWGFWWKAAINFGHSVAGIY